MERERRWPSLGSGLEERFLPVRAGLSPFWDESLFRLGRRPFLGFGLPNRMLESNSKTFDKIPFFEEALDLGFFLLCFIPLTSGFSAFILVWLLSLATRADSFSIFSL